MNKESLYVEESQRLNEGMSVAQKHNWKVTAPLVELSLWLKKARTLYDDARGDIKWKESGKE